MSSVSVVGKFNVSSDAFEANSLQDYLYSFFGLDDLKRMLVQHPGDMALKIWGVTLADYRNEIEKAIDLVVND